MVREGQETISSMAAFYGVHPETMRRALKRENGRG
jgi:transposase-like protein